MVCNLTSRHDAVVGDKSARRSLSKRTAIAEGDERMADLTNVTAGYATIGQGRTDDGDVEGRVVQKEWAGSRQAAFDGWSKRGCAGTHVGRDSVWQYGGASAVESDTK